MIMSDPQFMSYEDIMAGKYPHTAYCQCPLPIPPNGYAHVIKESGVEYECSRCGTKMKLYFGKEAEE